MIPVILKNLEMLLLKSLWQWLREHIDQNKGEIAALMVEPVQGEGGFKVGT